MPRIKSTPGQKNEELSMVAVRISSAVWKDVGILARTQEVTIQQFVTAALQRAIADHSKPARKAS